MILIDPVGYFIYGMCVMFYSMMAWFFWRKGSDVLSRLIQAIMLIYVVESLKDLVIYYYVDDMTSRWWAVMTSMDSVIIPLYSFVLMELVKPGWTTWRKAVMLELPFVLLPAIYCVMGNNIYFYILAVWGAVYGLTTFIVMFFLIRRYHRQLKERFSYQENINLNWLLAILSSCFLILIVWTMSCFVINVDFDDLYMVLSLTIWMFICYFVYKHESVIDELTDSDAGPIDDGLDDGNVAQGLAATVRQLFEEEKIYLNPKLKLSDVARMVGTNRTYLSRFFNEENGQTFYDFVNNYRVEHATQLLRTSSYTVLEVAEKSGFNSVSTFRRAFVAAHECSPNEYRAQM